MSIIDQIPILKRARLTRRAARLRQQRVVTAVPEPWMLPEQHSLIASYPRSGNTWLSHLVADVLLQNRGYPSATELPINEREIIPDLDRGDLETCRHADFAARPIAKTHLSYLNWMQKGIFLFREPADTLLSYFHFHNRYEERTHATSAGLESFCRKYAEEWFNHAMSFVWTCEESGGFIAVSYESLLQDPHTVLSKVLRHLEISGTEQQIQDSVSNHCFEKLARREANDREQSDQENERFFRKGKAGSAREEMTDGLLNWINAVCGPVYKRAAALPT